MISLLERCPSSTGDDGTRQEESRDLDREMLPQSFVHYTTWSSGFLLLQSTGITFLCPLVFNKNCMMSSIILMKTQSSQAGRMLANHWAFDELQVKGVPCSRMLEDWSQSLTATVYQLVAALKRANATGALDVLEEAAKGF